MKTQHLAVCLLSLLLFACVCPSPVKAQGNVLAYVPITITNNQGDASDATFPCMITINSSAYGAYIWANWSNVEFSTGSCATGTILNSWVETNCTNSSAYTVVWVQLVSSISGSGGQQIIYMDIMDGNVMAVAGPSGEAPQLSSSYGQYDDGALVFSFYDNFSGTVLNAGTWDTSGSPTYTVSNGLTFNASVSDTDIFTKDATFGNNSSTSVLDFYGNWIGEESSLSGAQTTIAYMVMSNTHQIGFNNFLTSNWPQTPNTMFGCFVCSWGGANFALGYNYSTAENVYTVMFNSSLVTSSVSYGSVASTSADIPSPPFVICVRGVTAICNDMFIQWVRARDYAPNGIMPSASFGSLVVNPVTYLLTVTVTGSGSLNESSANFTSGSIVSVLASPSAGYYFIFNGNGTDSFLNPLTFVMSGNYSLNCTFTINNTISVFVSGTVDPSLGYLVEYIILFAMLGITLYVRAFPQKLLLLLTVIFALMVNVASIAFWAPFTPYIQLFLSIFELVMLITSFRQY
jgi:hypothetical protein